MSENHPENALMYFPTEEEWTHYVRPGKLSIEDKFPEKFTVANIPIADSRTKQPQAQQNVSRKKVVGKKKFTPGTSSIKDYFSQAGSRPESRGTNWEDEGDN